MAIRSFTLRMIFLTMVVTALGPKLPALADAGQDAACARAIEDARGVVDLTDAQATALTGCYPEGNGWYYPEDGSDRDIPGGRLLTARDRSETNDLRSVIYAQLDDLRASYPGWIGGDLQRLQDEAIDEDGRLVPGFGVPWDATAATLYENAAPITAAFLLDPNNFELNVYAGWWFDRRMAAAPVSVGSPMLDQASRNVLQYDRLPWPWELGDPFNIDAFFAWALDRGSIAL